MADFEVTDMKKSLLLMMLLFALAALPVCAEEAAEVTV